MKSRKEPSATHKLNCNSDNLSGLIRLIAELLAEEKLKEIGTQSKGANNDNSQN